MIGVVDFDKLDMLERDEDLEEEGNGEDEAALFADADSDSDVEGRYEGDSDDEEGEESGEEGIANGAVDRDGDDDDYDEGIRPECIMYVLLVLTNSGLTIDDEEPLPEDEEIFLSLSDGKSHITMRQVEEWEVRGCISCGLFGRKRGH